MGNLDNMAFLGKQTLILAVETSSRIGSAALALGDVLLDETVFSNPMRHSAEIFPTIDGLLAKHGHSPRDIGQIHIAAGPGSFTGLRIAVTMAKAMHLAQGVKVVTVDSLDVVAANLGESAAAAQPQILDQINRIAALFDAKRGQFYVSLYDRKPAGAAGPHPPVEDSGYQIPAPGGSRWHKIHPDSLLTAQEIIEGFAAKGPLGVVGDGLLYHREEFAREGVVVLPESCWSPHAANVHRLGWQKALLGRFADPLGLTPFYLRGPQVTLKRKP
ncbi:MAG: tRNA (adenosine(37)-N6)-threonylcarbamoyltransferase complex dimerization subunit type 1 TsaB [Planctomycetes bacterium]|nr:tRNA (adenosine(37)-N6)-threonylcarbamoyltransferase complex dimerization subunit type 1 TsaB [Planctomycetota bacterium]